MSSRLFTFTAIFLSAFLVACSEQPIEQAQTMPATEIDVAAVPSTMLTDWHVYTTRLESPQSVELRPRITGIIESIEFEEGALVKEGDVLFTIDDRTFAAEVHNIQAQIVRAKAALQQAKSESVRAQSLRKKGAISAEETEARMSLTDQREAELEAMTASLEAALLNLEFTQVKSPINGRISNALLTKGNTAKANETVLTSIVSTERMYAYFDVDERTWNAYFSGLTSHSEVPVALELVGQKENKVYGVLDFIDNAIDQYSGTLRVRAAFENMAHTLIPGAFARVSIAPSKLQSKIIVPDRAIGTDLKNRFVLVVNEQNQLTYRKVTLGKRYGEYRAITDGLKESESIAVNGPAKVGPGMTIAPRKVTLEIPKSIQAAEVELAEAKQLVKQLAKL